ncbi:CsbD family protein [Alkaliflexus imshenetskii]|uniref:hypothetical protein n=1 Tax=Alkaliflexus imshenetskii TaxID=286730 RepID=UPI00047B0112|nr:hypothetical protein [Alkaliflexus imshenetskii]
MENQNKGFWEVKKEKIKIEFPNITDDDLMFYDGKEQIMLDMLSHKIGKSREELQKIIINI